MVYYQPKTRVYFSPTLETVKLILLKGIIVINGYVKAIGVEPVFTHHTGHHELSSERLLAIAKLAMIEPFKIRRKNAGLISLSHISKQSIMILFEKAKLFAYVVKYLSLLSIFGDLIYGDGVPVKRIFFLRHTRKLNS